MTAPGETALYRTGAAVAVVTAVLIVWTTIVRDDGRGAGFFLVIMAAGVGGFAAAFTAAGMARTMGGVAVMQLAWALAVATAPSTAAVPGASSAALLSGALSAGLWLVSGACFLAAARRGGSAVAAR